MDETYIYINSATSIGVKFSPQRMGVGMFF